MFHPTIVQKRISKQIDEIRRTPTTATFDVRPLAPELAARWVDHLGDTPRTVSDEEAQHILSESVLCKADFRYWAERYGMIKNKAGERKRIAFMESQEIILRKVQQLELDAMERRRTDGILIQILKARQLGASTFAELVVAHRGFLYGNLFGLVAGDVPEQSAYLFDMLERVYKNLPWWMRPTLTNHVKDYEMNFGEVDTLIRMTSGKSTRGGFNLEQGRGQAGRGKTINLFHGSELSTWDEPTQIDSSVEPAIPRHPRSFGFLESTARGQDNWWHQTWRASVKGLGRWTPVFIPWYAETNTYRQPVPAGWDPLPITKAHADKAERESGRWCGRTIRLDREQLYWWEMSYLAAKEKRLLHIYLAEYCADPEEAFTSTSQSVFDNELLYSMRQEAKPLVAVVDVLEKLPR